MNRKAIVISALTLLILSGSLSSCSWKKKATETDPAGKTAVETASGPDYRSGATVVEEADDTGSGGIEKTEVSSGSVLELGAAINSEKIQACDKLGSETDAKACRDLVYFKAGTEDHDYEQCDKISRERNRQICSSRISRYLLEFGDCQKIRDEAIQKDCLKKNDAAENAMIERTNDAQEQVRQKLADAAKAGTAESRVTATCASVTGANKNYCYSVKVSEEIQKGAPATLCSIIPDAQTKSACEQKASAVTNKSVLDEAIAAKNPALCDKIALQQDKDLCKKIVASGK